MADTNIVNYMQNNGYTLINHGKNYFRTKEHDSLIINKDGTRFHWNSKDTSGNLVDLVTILENKTLDEAIKDVYGKASKTKTKVSTSKDKNTGMKKEKEVIPFKLPTKNSSTKRVFYYLSEKRKLSTEVINFALKNDLVYQDEKGNAIFVGYDENKVPKFATLRGTYEKVFRGDIASSDKEVGFSIVNKNSDKVYICESPIDALSLMTLNKDFNGTHNYLSLNGVSTNALTNFLEKNKNIKTLITALDRDNAGIQTTKKIWNTYRNSYTMGNYFLFVKDVNEQLINMKQDIQVVVTDCNVSDPFNKGEIMDLKNFKICIDEIEEETYVKIDIYKGKISLMEDIVCFQDENQNFDLYETILNKKNKLDKSIENHLNMIKELQLEYDEEVIKKEVKDAKAIISKYKYGSDILMDSLRKELGIDITKDKDIETGIKNSVKNIEKNFKNQNKEQETSLSITKDR